MNLQRIVLNQTLKRITDDMHATIISANGFECRVNLTNFKKLWADPFYISFRMLMESFHEFRLAEPNSVPFLSIGAQTGTGIGVQ